MANELSTWAAGDTNYIATHNADNAVITAALNGHDADIAGLESSKVDVSSKGQPGGVAGLDSNGDVPTANLPDTVEYTGRKGAANGYAELDSGGHVPILQLPIAVQEVAGGAGIDLTGYQLKTAKDQPSGYAGLDSGGKILDSEIPAAIARDSEVTAALASYETSAHAAATYDTPAARDSAIADALAGYAPATQPVMLPIWRSGKPAAGEVMLYFRPTVPVTFAADLAGWHVDVVEANPTGTAVVSVKKNGSEEGTISIDTSGTPTLSAASPIALNGTTDYLTIVAPASQDATLAGLAITAHGTR